MFDFIEISRIAIIGLLIVIPAMLIYRKAGFHPVWALLVFLPGFGLLIIFMHLAFLPWPNQKNSEKSI